MPPAQTLPSGADAHVVLAGLRFLVQTPDRLSGPERTALAALGATADTPPSGDDAIVVRIEASPPAWHEATARSDGPPAVLWADGCVRVQHSLMAAEIHPFERRVTLFREAERAWPLEVTLRVALAATLPGKGGLPLHAAGVVIAGSGLVFFGPSGAGKSTLAATSPFPVLSDEMVAVVPSSLVEPAGGGAFSLAPTGFWGELDGSGLRASVPLAALAELGKGEAFSLERLGRREALPRLIASTLVPPAPPLWGLALGVLGELVRRVPVYRMRWRPSEPSWDRLREKLIPH